MVDQLAMHPAPKPLSMLTTDTPGAQRVEHGQQGGEAAEARAVADAGRHGDDGTADQAADHAGKRALHAGHDDQDVGGCWSAAGRSSSRCRPATPTS